MSYESDITNALVPMNSLVPVDRDASEEDSLRTILRESRKFDSSFGTYGRLAKRAIDHSMKARITRAAKDALQECGMKFPGLAESYSAMMGSLGVMSAELEGLCQVHREDGVGIRELVKSRYERMMDLGDAYDTAEGSVAELHAELSELEASLRGELPFRARLEGRMRLRGLRMGLYEKQKMHAGLQVQMQDLERSAELLEQGHRAHTDVFMTYVMAVDAGRKMHEELQVLGPSQVTSVYLGAGLNVFQKHLAAVGTQNSRLKSCVRSRWSSYELKNTGSRGGYEKSSALASFSREAV